MSSRLLSQSSSLNLTKTKNLVSLKKKATLAAKSGGVNKKVFSQRFNSELALQGYPSELSEKKYAITKAFGVNSHVATSMIFGYELPNKEVLDTVSEVLEVCPQWLVGVTDKKKAYIESDH
jgi:hypothetical protein